MHNPETQIHRAVVQHLRARGVPGLVWWHTPNGAKLGGKNPARHGAIMKSLGMRPGVSDLILLHAGRFYALELKSEGGRATEAQLEFISDVNEAGGYGMIAEGVDSALRILEAWQLLKGKIDRKSPEPSK